jgi:hypothetical protein
MFALTNEGNSPRRKGTVDIDRQAQAPPAGKGWHA